MTRKHDTKLRTTLSATQQLKKKKGEAKSERVLGEKRRVRMRWIDGEVK